MPYALSYREIEERMLEQGIKVDHSTINRWVIKYCVELATEFCKYKNKTNSAGEQMKSTSTPYWYDIITTVQLTNIDAML